MILRVYVVDCAEPLPRRREESPSFRLRLCCAVFICGFILRTRLWLGIPPSLVLLFEPLIREFVANKTATNSTNFTKTITAGCMSWV